MKNNNGMYLLPVALMLMGVLITGCHKDSYRAKVGMIWNTTYHIRYCGPESLGDSIGATLNRVGESVNAFDSLSTLSRINRNETDTADAMLSHVVECAKTVWSNSDGAFDPTLGPAIRAWGFGKGHQATADTANLDSLRQFVGFDKWVLNEGIVKKLSKGVELNLSGIAKGFGCDAVAEMFRRNGVTDYMIEIGGEIRIGGKGEHGDKWRIAIDSPEVSDSVIHDFLTTIEITDCGLATSGDYRNYHTDSAGNRFGHTLDPKTLRPAHTDVLSATVVASTSMEADAYATACMVLGSEKAQRMADRLKLKVILVNGKGVWMSDEMKKLIGREK